MNAEDWPELRRYAQRQGPIPQALRWWFGACARLQATSAELEKLGDSSAIDDVDRALVGHNSAQQAMLDAHSVLLHALMVELEEELRQRRGRARQGVQ